MCVYVYVCACVQTNSCLPTIIERFESVLLPFCVFYFLFFFFAFKRRYKRKKVDPIDN